jgi:hypothetical protein
VVEVNLADDPPLVVGDLHRVFDLAPSTRIDGVPPLEQAAVTAQNLPAVAEEVDPEPLVEVALDAEPAPDAPLPHSEVRALALVALGVRRVLPRAARLADGEIAQGLVDLDDGRDHLAVPCHVARPVPDAVPVRLDGDLIDLELEALGVQEIRVDAPEDVPQPALVGAPREPGRERL